MFTVRPTSFEDVSAAVLRSTAESLPLRVRSGFHSTALPTQAEHGLLVDLSALNAFSIDADRQVAHVQSGCRFAEIEREAIKHGLALPAGTVADVGVGGLSTGGGYGWLSGEHGLTIDSLLQATVVVASGEILTASPSKNADLFWGIRGGGSNFGVVVEFVFQLYPQRPDVYVTSLTFAGSLLPIVVQQINRWTMKQTPNESARLTFATDTAGKPVVNFLGVKNAGATAGAASFKPFVNLGPIENDSRMVPYEELNTLLNGYMAPGHKLHMGLHLERLDLKPFKKAFEGLSDLVDKHPEAAESHIAFEFYHSAKIASVPEESTAFAHRSAAHNVLITTQWSNEGFTSLAKATTLDLADKIAKSASSDLKTNIGYPNYADLLARDNKTDSHARLAFGANYARMQQVKAKYDPENVFCEWFAVKA